MAQSLYSLENIYFVAGRHYVHDGVTYEPGDVVEGARTFRNVEAMVRSRHLIPVVDNHNDVPVYFQKDVKLASLVEEKFRFTIKHPDVAPDSEDEEPVEDGLEDEQTEEVTEAYNPAEHTVPEVLEYVGNDKERAAAVLEAETSEGGKNRSTLTGALEELLTAPENEEIEL